MYIFFGNVQNDLSFATSLLSLLLDLNARYQTYKFWRERKIQHKKTLGEEAIGINDYSENKMNSRLSRNNFRWGNDCPKGGFSKKSTIPQNVK